MPEEGKRIRPVHHPLIYRLKQDSIFFMDRRSLVSTGFSSMAMGIFTAFRPTPVLLLLIISKIRTKDGVLTFFYEYGTCLIYSWLSFIFFTLFAGGLVMACSGKIKKRSVLLIHPWALLFLYFDGFFWLSITVYLHVLTGIYEHDREIHFEDFKYPVVSFVFIYFDIVMFIIIHYVFATYFMAAQLTVIENHY